MNDEELKDAVAAACAENGVDLDAWRVETRQSRVIKISAGGVCLEMRWGYPAWSAEEIEQVDHAIEFLKRRRERVEKALRPWWKFW